VARGRWHGQGGPRRDSRSADHDHRERVQRVADDAPLEVEEHDVLVSREAGGEVVGRRALGVDRVGGAERDEAIAREIDARREHHGVVVTEVQRDDPLRGVDLYARAAREDGEPRARGDGPVGRRPPLAARTCSEAAHASGRPAPCEAPRGVSRGLTRFDIVADATPS
jgi:hypothetical protein